MKKRKSNFFVYVIACCSVVVLLALFSIFLSFSKAPVGVEIIKINFIIHEKNGIDLNSSYLSFGNIVPGNSLQRNLKIKNNHQFPVLMKLEISDSVKDFVYSEKEAILLSGEEREFPVSLIIPVDAEFGSFNGQLVIKFYKIKED